VQLRDARFIHPELLANRLHRGVAEVVERNQLLVTHRKISHGLADTKTLLIGFVQRVGTGRLGWYQHAVMGILVGHIGGRLHRGRLNRGNAHHRALQMGFILAKRVGQLGQRGLVTQTLAQGHPGRFDLATDTAHPAGPGILPQRVNHGAADAAFRKGLELDTPRFIEPLRRINQTQHTVLHQVTNLDRVGHRRSHAARQCLDEWKAGSDTVAGVSVEHLHARL